MVAGDERFTQSDYFVRECGQCGLLYRTPTLSQSDLERYYAKTDFRKWEIAGYFPTECRVLKILRALPKSSRILDFGCSSGRLLAELCEDYACHGVEVNDAAANEAAKKGIKILSSADLGNPAFPRFDAIVLVDVFEHMAQPLALIRRLAQLLAKNGSMILVTGNGDAPACRRDPAQFWYFRHLEHLCMVTRKHADYLCSTLGLRLEPWHEVTHYDLSFREKLVQVAQDFAYWQFRNQTWLARHVLRFVPGMTGLKSGASAPSFTCSRDHVVAVFTK